MARFDWGKLRLPHWVPLVDFCQSATQTSGGLYKVSLDEGIFVLTSDLGMASGARRVGAVLWANSLRTALLIYDRTWLEVDESPWPPPPASVVDFEPLTFAAALAHAKRTSSIPVQHNATYAYPSGVFTTSHLATDDREYYFSSPNPEPDDEIIAIRFDLPHKSDHSSERSRYLR